jgi:hypothetical protein
MTYSNMRFIGIVIAIMAVAGCTKSEEEQGSDSLKSDMQLRDAAFYVDHQAEREEMEAVCIQWKSSQRPPASWPSVVVATCNNVDTANQLLRTRKDRDEFKKGMGV